MISKNVMNNYLKFKKIIKTCQTSTYSGKCTKKDEQVQPMGDKLVTTPKTYATQKGEVNEQH